MTRSGASLLADLRTLPANPKPVTGTANWLNIVTLVAEYATTVPPAVHRLTVPFRRYPAPFEKVRFPSRDGVRLVGWLGRAPERAGASPDAVILIPGLYTSKDNPRIRARAVRIRREWGHHVLCLDQRGVGESERTFSSPGMKEAEDILEAAAFLRRTLDVGRIHVYAESLAASAAIVAAGLSADPGEPQLGGTVLAMSPFADPRTIVRLYGHGGEGMGPEFATVQRTFNLMLRLQGYRGGRFDAYVRDAARHYGIPLDEFYDRSTPARWINKARTPLLVVHSQDDGLVPVSEAEALRAAAQGNPNVGVWVLPWGYHCLYEMADPDWYWSVLARAFPKAPSYTPA